MNASLDSQRTCDDLGRIALVLGGVILLGLAGCQASVFDASCIPACESRECGDDGCGGSCGTCSSGSCNGNGQCEPATEVPGAPTIGTASVIDATHVKVSWSDGASGSSAITGYTVTPYVGGVAQPASTYTVSETTLEGLVRSARKSATTGTTYTFTVAAESSVGTGEPSALSNAVTPQTTCAPSCTSKECGDDGCGGSCGTCSSGSCNGSGQCVTTTGCAAAPSTCGFPDATNTGITPGTVLKTVPGQVSSGPGWEWDSRGFLRVSNAGAVVEGLDLDGEIYVTVPNVTVRNCRVRMSGQSSMAISIRPGADGAIVEHNDLSGLDTGSGRMMVAVKVWGVSSVTVRTNRIARVSTGIQTDVGLVEGNYIDDMGYLDGDHLNGFTSNSWGGETLTIRNNTIFNSFGQTDAISLFQDFGVQKNVLIESNLVAGGGYTFYGGGGGNGVSSNIRIINNRVSRVFYSSGGSYGWIAHFDSNGQGNELSGNVWDETGALIP